MQMHISSLISYNFIYVILFTFQIIRQQSKRDLQPHYNANIFCNCKLKTYKHLPTSIATFIGMQL